MNVSLPLDLKQWVDIQVKHGGYDSASEYLRDLLRRARDRDARRKMDGLLVAGVQSGATILMDDADWAGIRKAAKSAGKRGKAPR